MDAKKLATLSAEEKRLLLAELLQKKASNSKTIYSLSHNQRAMWFLHQLAPESSAYNLGLALYIHSKVEISALKQALQILINRHSALRTNFILASGEPVQEVHGYRETHFEEIDASGWSDEELDQQVVAAYKSPFNLEQDPAMRVHLFTRSATEYILLLTLHHIGFDGWSAWLLLDELRLLYAARESSTPPLPPLNHQYDHYVQWQRDMLAGPPGERMWNYWQQQLGGELPLLNLPTDKPRPAIQTYEGSTHHFVLDEPLTQQLKALAKAEGATLYMTLLAVFQVLLHRYSGQPDILVGSPMSGRSRSEFNGIVGDFINMVVLRTNFSDNPSFRTLLSQVRQTVLEALEHQDYPFSLLVEQLAPERDPSRSPLFQVSFALQKPQRFSELTKSLPGGKDKPRLDFGGLQLENLNLIQQEGQLDLSLDVIEAEGKLFGILRYNTDMYEAATIARMQQHLQTLLESLVANPEQKVSNLPLLPEREKHQILVEWNDTRLDYPQDQCVQQLFEAQVEKTPNKTALVFEDKHLSYAELNQRANQLARHLQNLGVGPETLVGVYMERSLEMVVGLLGILKAGGAYVPLDPAFPKDRLAFMVDDAQVRILLTQQDLLREIPLSEGGQVVCLDRDWPEIAQQSSELLPQQSQPDNLIYVIYTSGSTGKPKGVQILQRAVVNFLTSMRQEPGLQAEDSLLSVTTLSFDISVLEIFLPLTTGTRLVLVSRATATDGAELLSRLNSSNITVMQATPTTWRMLIEAGWSGTAGLKILCGGEALPRDLAQQLLPRCAELWNVYGPTETTIWSTLYQIRSSEAPVLIGRPLGNTQCYILDAQFQPMPAGIAGELYIAGDGLARGYLNRPELTREKFIRDPFKPEPDAKMYRTGDLARYLSDGSIDFLGRIDHQVKIRGYRIELGEIEVALTQHPALREAVVIVREDIPGDKRLVAYLIADKPEAPSVTELRTFVRETLPDYMVPSAFVFVEAYPLTPNKKIDRKALPSPDQTKVEVDSGFVAPSTPTEILLAEIWREVLGVEQISVYDNFFDLGGHSLLSAKVVAKLEQKTGHKIPLAYFGYQSLGQLAASYDAQTNLHQQPEAVDVAQTGLNGSDQLTVKTDPIESVEGHPKSLLKRTFEPFFFGPAEQQLFGCYHPPQIEAERDAAVVICYPMSQEYIRSHRACQQLAIRLARAGFPVLRFDYSGCGDSQGEGEEASFAQWLSDISISIAEVRKRSGLRQVYLVGLRLGAALAMLAGTQQEDVAGLVLWEPTINGKSYLDELRLRHQEIIWQFPVPLKGYVMPNVPAELLGFPLSETLFSDMEKLDLAMLEQKPTQRVLIVEGQEKITGAPLKQHLQSRAVPVTHQHIPSFTIWIEDVDKGLVPHQTLEAIVSWITEGSV